MILSCEDTSGEVIMFHAHTLELLRAERFNCMNHTCWITGEEVHNGWTTSGKVRRGCTTSEQVRGIMIYLEAMVKYVYDMN